MDSVVFPLPIYILYIYVGKPKLWIINFSSIHINFKI